MINSSQVLNLWEDIFMLGFLNLNVRSYNQDQNLPFPPHLRDRLPDDHLAVIINDIVDGLDLSPLYIKIPTEGAPSYLASR